MDYKVNGNMVAGHALLAFPAEPGETGVMSFLVGENEDRLWGQSRVRTHYRSQVRFRPSDRIKRGVLSRQSE